jgi:hypothetical protein
MEEIKFIKLVKLIKFCGCPELKVLPGGFPPDSININRR